MIKKIAENMNRYITKILISRFNYKYDIKTQLKVELRRNLNSLFIKKNYFYVNKPHYLFSLMFFIYTSFNSDAY